MRTNIDIDDTLMKNAIRASRTKTKKAAVVAGLELLVRMDAQEKALRELRGIGKWEGSLEQSRLGHVEN